MTMSGVQNKRHSQGILGEHSSCLKSCIEVMTTLSKTLEMLCQGNGGHLGTPAGSKAPVPAGLHFLPFMSSVYTVLWQLWRVIIKGSILYNAHPSFLFILLQSKSFGGLSWNRENRGTYIYMNIVLIFS